MSDSELWTALTKVPLTLKDAAVLLRAQNYNVGYEAAAILAFKEKVQMKSKTETEGGARDWKKTELTVKSIVQDIASNKHKTQTSATGHRFLIISN